LIDRIGDEALFAPVNRPGQRCTAHHRRFYLFRVERVTLSPWA
jgi:hypothetical protein